jgi:ElaB/YqjD/DUF883 family membrane-anchored ribosome-binding protein
MNTPARPYSPGHSTATGSGTSSAAMTETARSAVDTVKDTMSDAVDRGQAALSHARDAAGEMAETATQQVKTFASELDAMAKRNPLGTIAGAVMIGVLIGFLARGRT